MDCKKREKSAIDASLEVISEILARRETLAFVGFGTFSTSKRAARTAKVPFTNKIVKANILIISLTQFSTNE